MTPGARVAAAIAVLDQIATGVAAEQALTTWARASRFAGSGDRAAVRDHVFDVLRCKRSLGDGDGRALMLALARRDGWDVGALFSGEGYAPPPLTAKEEANQPAALTPAAAHDIPDWLWPAWQDSLGDHATDAAKAQQGRAPVFLRVNRQNATVDQVADALASEGIATRAHPDVPGCLEITANARRFRNARAYRDGWCELQDASSQAAVAAVPLKPDARVLDYCAGGGGKALAFADRGDCTVFAHDIAPQRMRDIPARAARAGVRVPMIAGADFDAAAPFDVVFCDAPCSGSGTWRRTPDAKWRLTEGTLDGLIAAQADVLSRAAPLVAPGGLLIYATCSVLASENADQIRQFQDATPAWDLVNEAQFLPSAEGDGFYFCQLRRSEKTT